MLPPCQEKKVICIIILSSNHVTGIELGRYMIPLSLHKTSFDASFILILENVCFLKPLLSRMMVTHQ